LLNEMGVFKEGIKRGREFMMEIRRNLIAEQFGGEFRKDFLKTLDKIETAGYGLWSLFDRDNRAIAGLGKYYKVRDQLKKSHDEAIREGRECSRRTQFGYNRADGMLIDMTNPITGWIPFKKWISAKIEMLNEWRSKGMWGAILAFLTGEALLYYTLRKKLKVDPTWWIFPEIRMIEFAWRKGQIGDVPLADIFRLVKRSVADSPDGRKAREKLKKIGKAGGIRYIEKIEDFIQHYHDEWKVYDETGKLDYVSSLQEEVKRLLGFYPMERKEAWEKGKKMAEERFVYSDYKNEIIRAQLAGKLEEAGRLINKYYLYTEKKYGKGILIMPTKADRMRYLQNMMTTREFRQWKTMPKTLKPEFLGK